MTALFDQIKGAKDIPEALEKVADWMDGLLAHAESSYSQALDDPEVYGLQSHKTGDLSYTKNKADDRAWFWYSNEGVEAISKAVSDVAEYMKQAAPPTPNSVQDADAAIKQARIKEEDEASVRLVNNLNSIITKYLDVGEALGLVGHDRGLIADELFSDGETRQIGKSHKAMMRKIENLRDDNHGHVKEGALLSLREKCQELETDVAVWRYELLDIAKNLGVIDDSPIKDSDAAKTIGPSVGAKCYEMRTQIKDLKVISSAQATTIIEHKTALNAAHDEIAKLKAEIAALKAAPPSPPPSDPLTTAYAVIGEMVVKSRQG